MALAARFCTAFAIVFAAAILILAGVAHADNYWPDSTVPGAAPSADTGVRSSDGTGGDTAASAAAVTAAGSALSARVRHDGAVVVAMNCGVGTQYRCGGRLTLRTVDKLRAGGRSYARDAALGSGAYALAGGAQGTVTLRLSPALGKLARHGGISSLGIETDGSGGQTVTLQLQLQR